MTENNTLTHQDTLVKMVLDVWNSKVSQLDKLLTLLSDEDLLKEVSPGRNSGRYLLGHLTALADSIIPLAGFGEKLVPEYLKIFAQTPEKENNSFPPLDELRRSWVKVKTSLGEKMEATSSQEWFQKHTAISEEDFAKEPHRNKLNVVLSRATHMDYHLGQLTFLKPR